MHMSNGLRQSLLTIRAWAVRFDVGPSPLRLGLLSTKPSEFSWSRFDESSSVDPSLIACSSGFDFAFRAGRTRCGADPPASDPNPGRMTLTGSFDVVSTYMFRGIRQNSTGVALWPAAHLGLALYSADTARRHHRVWRVERPRWRRVSGAWRHDEGIQWR